MAPEEIHMLFNLKASLVRVVLLIHGHTLKQLSLLVKVVQFGTNADKVFDNMEVISQCL